MPIISSIGGGSVKGFGQRNGPTDPKTVSFDYVIIAGGGAGGYTVSPPCALNTRAGGGGAGGFATSYCAPACAVTVPTGTTYTITVGAGGATPTGTPQRNPGANTIAFCGTPYSLRVNGGGGGAPNGEGGGPGGSGGGGAPGIPPRAGGDAITACAVPWQLGFPGSAGYGINANPFNGGGGGGAGSGGPKTTISQVGGNGVSNSITGSPVAYAGGGTAMPGCGVPQPLGGSISGADGADGTGAGGGGGGGGSGPWNKGSAGADGVVILRFPTDCTPSKFAVSPGCNTTAIDGTDTVVTFNVTGTLTL